MPFYSQRDFSQISDDLASLFVATAAQYAKNKGLPPIDAAALRQMSTPLSAVAAETLMFGCDVWPETAYSAELELAPIPFEVAASETDPPISYAALVCSFIAVVFTVTIGTLLRTELGAGDYITIAFSVAAISLVFGSLQGLIHAGISHLAHNFFLVPPILTLTWPTPVELTMAAFFVTLALTLPWIALRSAKWRTLALARLRFSASAVSPSH